MNILEARKMRAIDAQLSFYDIYEHLFWAIYCGNDSVVQHLLEHGADVNAIDDKGLTPLHHASMRSIIGIKDSIKVILRYKPWINKQDKLLQTPLNLLVKRSVYDQELLKEYLDSGADPNIPDNEGRTTLHHLAENHSALDWRILFHCFHLLIKHDADVNITDKDGNTPLHIAIMKGQEFTIKMFLDNGARIDIKNSKHKTQMDLAMKSKYYAVLELLGIHFLMQYGLTMQGRKKYLRRLLRNGCFPELWIQCCAELEKLKSDKIGHTFYTYYQMLTSSPYEMAKLFRNEDALMATMVYDTNKYEYYRLHLNHHIQKAFEIYQSREIGYRFRDKVWPWVPELCMEKIMQYLRNIDLNKLEYVVDLEIYNCREKST